MIAKIVKGRGFKGVVNYALDQKKEAELIGANGVRANSHESIIRNFVTQAGMNPRLSKPVCHISLSFAPQDRDKLTNDTMVRIACEYLAAMGAANTQFIVARHFDKEHPHIHVVFNRVGNDGKTISDQNDRFRSEKICKKLTQKYGLHFALGKDNVNEQRLREPDKTKYEIYNALKAAVPKCKGWPELVDALKRQSIGVELIRNGDTDKIQGVKFSKNGYPFNGSKIDRQFSYSKIDSQLRQNGQDNEVKNTPAPPSRTISPAVGHPSHQTSPPPHVTAPTNHQGGSALGVIGNAVGEALSVGADIASGLAGAVDFTPHGAHDENEAEFLRQQRLRKKKKPRKGRSI